MTAPIALAVDVLAEAVVDDQVDRHADGAAALHAARRADGAGLVAPLLAGARAADELRIGLAGDLADRPGQRERPVERAAGRGGPRAAAAPARGRRRPRARPPWSTGRRGARRAPRARRAPAGARSASVGAAGVTGGAPPPPGGRRPGRGSPGTEVPSERNASGLPIRSGTLTRLPTKRVSSSLVRITRLTPARRKRRWRSPRSDGGVAAGSTRCTSSGLAGPSRAASDSISASCCVRAAVGVDDDHVAVGERRAAGRRAPGRPRRRRAGRRGAGRGAARRVVGAGAGGDQRDGQAGGAVGARPSPAAALVLPTPVWPTRATRVPAPRGASSRGRRGGGRRGAPAPRRAPGPTGRGTAWRSGRSRRGSRRAGGRRRRPSAARRGRPRAPRARRPGGRARRARGAAARRRRARGPGTTRARASGSSSGSGLGRGLGDRPRAAGSRPPTRARPRAPARTAARAASRIAWLRSCAAGRERCGLARVRGGRRGGRERHEGLLGLLGGGQAAVQVAAERVLRGLGRGLRCGRAWAPGRWVAGRASDVEGVEGGGGDRGRGLLVRGARVGAGGRGDLDALLAEEAADAAADDALGLQDHARPRRARRAPGRGPRRSCRRRTA